MDFQSIAVYLLSLIHFLHSLIMTWWTRTFSDGVVLTGTPELVWDPQLQHLLLCSGPRLCPLCHYLASTVLEEKLQEPYVWMWQISSTAHCTQCWHPLDSCHFLPVPPWAGTRIFSGLLSAWHLSTPSRTFWESMGQVDLGADSQFFFLFGPVACLLHALVFTVSVNCL